MKKGFGLTGMLGKAALAALIVLVVGITSCDNNSIPDQPLSGIVTISPSGATTGTQLTANYNGSESGITYQWNKGGTAITGAIGRTYTPSAAGSYTVTVSAPGYGSKTSAAVIVTPPFKPPYTPPTYTVTFDSQGGSAVSPISGISSGAAISAPTAPVWVGNIFQNWYKDAGYTTLWDFGTDTVTGNITLYAKWQFTATEVANAQDFPGASAITTYPISSAGEFAFAKGVIETSAGNYILDITGTVNLGSDTLTPAAGANVSIRGGGTLKYTGTGSLINLTGGSLILRDAVLEGHAGNTAPLVNMFGALDFTMYGGAITGNGGGGVSVGTGVFTMNGGTISGNTAGSTGNGGGVNANIPIGFFYMNGGTITGNIASGNGGGVYSPNPFNMSGGTISGNRASGDGGGVYGGGIGMTGGTISGNQAGGSGGGVYGDLNMSDGTISGNQAGGSGGGVYGSGLNKTGGTITGAGGPNPNTASTSGAAVYDNGRTRYRNTTAGPGVTVDITDLTADGSGFWLH